ncbi:MAG: pyridoxal phosphate-dependent aminotransferase [Alphaproteobacteria bacterium]|nr:pyridoxal phosphate-dependent aminotransferase [Alphaproteobacteria bacterium]
MPEKKNFCRIAQNLPPNVGAEILRYGWRKPDILSLGQGEGNAPTPDFIMDGAVEALRAGKTHYGPVLGQPVLREALSSYYEQVFNFDIPANRLFVTGSGTTAMHLALTSILEKGDEVVAVTPIWKNLLGAVELAEARIVQVPLDFGEEESGSQKGWSLDLERLLAAVTDKTKALLIVTPSNPTGWMMSEEEMRHVLDFARARGIWIISDEVYSRTAYGLSHAPSFLGVAQADDLLITVNSFSKSWAMTGWRLGWLVGPAAAEEIIRDIALYDNMGPPTFTQFGAVKALEDGEDFIAQQMVGWEANRDYMMERLGAHPKITMVAPSATFYAFFKVEGEPDCLTFAKRLIDEQSLSLAPGCAFGAGAKGWMRLCFAVSRPRLEEALDRLERAL